MKLFIALAVTFLLAFSAQAAPKHHSGAYNHHAHKHHDARRWHQNRWRHRHHGPRRPRPYFVFPFYFGW